MLMQKTSVDILRSVELEIQNRYISFQGVTIYIYIWIMLILAYFSCVHHSSSWNVFAFATCPSEPNIRNNSPFFPWSSRTEKRSKACARGPWQSTTLGHMHKQRPRTTPLEKSVQPPAARVVTWLPHWLCERLLFFAESPQFIPVGVVWFSLALWGANIFYEGLAQMETSQESHDIAQSHVNIWKRII